jgi:hypothetical protein
MLSSALSALLLFLNFFEEILLDSTTRDLVLLNLLSDLVVALLRLNQVFFLSKPISSTC